MTNQAPSPRRRSPVTLRIFAVVAGVVAVPALYAVASAATGHRDVVSASSSRDSASASSVGLETEVEHGVLTTKPHGGVDDTTSTTAPTPSTSPAATVPSTAPDTETELEHGVLVTKPHGGGGEDGDEERTVTTPTPTAPITQTFSSAGGTVQVTLTDGTVSLTSSTPAAGFTAEVHDNGPRRVEVRFFSGGNEWRIRVEPAGGAFVSEISQHG